MRIEVKRLTADRKRAQTRREISPQFAPYVLSIPRRSRRSTGPYGAARLGLLRAATATTNRVTATVIDAVPSIKVVGRVDDHPDLSTQAVTQIVIDAKIGGDWCRALAWSSVYQPL